MYPTFCSFRCCSIFSCSSLFLCICCCKFLISACLLSISARRFFSSFSIFSFFRASRDASFWCSWISCWSYNNREEKCLTSAAFYSGQQGLSPLLLLCLILKTTASILLYPLLQGICQVFSEVNKFSSGWTKKSCMREPIYWWQEFVKHQSVHPHRSIWYSSDTKEFLWRCSGTNVFSVVSYL